jgi:hypothetical protein
MNRVNFACLFLFIIPLGIACTPEYGGYCIQITNPTGGETFHIGDTIHITWDQIGIDTIDLSVNGINLYDIPTDPNLTSGAYDLLIAPNTHGSNRVKVMIAGGKKGVGNQAAYSNEFTIMGTCNDTDGGKNYEVSGITSASGNTYSNIDTCIDKTTLREWFCTDYGAENSENHKCAVACNPGQDYTDAKCMDCTDECQTGQKECSGSGFRLCGNYDSDSCSEWSSITACPDKCELGQCTDNCVDRTNSKCDDGVYIVTHAGHMQMPATHSLEYNGKSYTLSYSESNGKVLVKSIRKEDGSCEKSLVNEGEKAIFFDCTIWAEGGGPSEGYRLEGHDRPYLGPNSDYVKGDIITLSNGQRIEITDSRTPDQKKVECQVRVTKGSESETRWITNSNSETILGINITDQSSFYNTKFYDQIQCTYTIEESASDQICTDSDGGINYYVLGHTSKEDYDKCIDNVTLSEVYCQGSASKVITTQCPSGCRNGACTSEVLHPVNETIPSIRVEGEGVNESFIPQAEQEHEIVPQPECTTARDCNDNDPCTVDSCSGSPIACRHEEHDGCPLAATCVPYGTRSASTFCSLNKTMVTQKDNNAFCDNNYECVSNVCVNSKCITPGVIQRFLDWLARFFK